MRWSNTQEFISPAGHTRRLNSDRDDHNCNNAGADAEHNHNDSRGAVKNDTCRARPHGDEHTCDATVIRDDIASGIAPARHTHSRKGQNGKVLVIGGSYTYHGAPILASLAALRFGTDLVYTAVPKHNVAATRSASPDLIVLPMADAKLTRGSARKLLGMSPVGLDAVAIGMGLAVHERGALLHLVKSYTDTDARLVLDASALVPEVLPVLENTNSIITPHAGEFKHLFGGSVPAQSDVKSRIRTVRTMAQKHGVTIMLKGHTDVISDGDASYLCTAGSPGMTVGGTGDVLAGLAAGALAHIRNPLDAAALAAYVNGRAGELAASRLGYHMIASDLVGSIPAVLRGFDAACDNSDHCCTGNATYATRTGKTGGFDA